MTTNNPDLIQERSLFEAWASERRYDLSLCGEGSRVGPADAFLNTATAHAWEVWLARANVSVVEGYRKMVEEWAFNAGWTPGGDESAFEFVRRTSYELGRDDASTTPILNVDAVQLPEPDHYDTNYRRHAWSESLVRKAIKDAATGKQLPVELELSIEDKREVKIWWDEVRGNKRHLCISVDPLKDSALMQSEAEEEAAPGRITKEMWDSLNAAHVQLIASMRKREAMQRRMNMLIAPISDDEIKMTWRKVSQQMPDGSLLERLTQFGRDIEAMVKSMRANIINPDIDD